MKVCVVTVTYGNRFHLLEKLLNALLDIAISEVVIVSNGSKEESSKALKAYLEGYPKSFNLLELSSNIGSAGGFRLGIEQTLKSSCDFVWILDDDNLPKKDALEVLKKYWAQLVDETEYQQTALVSNRIDRQNFNKVLATKRADDILPRKNNFMGFHWADMFERLYERLYKKSLYQDAQVSDYAKIPAAPYGGLFFHRSLLNNIDLPPKEYVLYMDDFAFTLPITENGGNIYLIGESILEDSENSTYLPKSKKWLHHTLFDSKIQHSYYTLRNILYFCKKHLLDNFWVFKLNQYSFYVLIATMAVLRGETSRLKVLKDAVEDVDKGRMGLNDNYIL